MKSLFFPSMFLLAAIITTTASFQQNDSKKKAKPNYTKFIGKWKGSERCSDVSAPVALLFVDANGPELKLSGLYSIQGGVRAMVVGDTIIIPKQEVDDPNFMNMQIEGKLGFGINPFSLGGYIRVINNQKNDACEVKYYK
ncbi:MAG TPA: hypothetical protein VK154_15410 [Chitinophagales bacterium]|nr:hypothetical protein [Chitinophagales bacterium]